MEDATSITSTSRNHLYKLLIVGDYAVGKTSLIRRYCNNEFTSNYRITIGVDFCVKQYDYDDNTSVSLQLWDIAGHERFGAMTRVYYKFAIAAVVCFDVSRPSTLDNVKKWRDDINDKVVLPDGSPIPMLLLANKVCCIHCIH
jgi:Ras-related protein Rab-32